MAAHRARDAARQLKVDIKHSMRLSSRSKERTTVPDATSTVIRSNGRHFLIAIKEKG